MAFIGELWLPILLSGVLVFIASALVWTVLKYHNGEWHALPNQDAVHAALKTSNPAAGLYMIPFTTDEKERHSPEFMAKVAEGPSGMLTVMPRGKMSMGAMMAKSLVVNWVVSFFIAYVAWHAFEHRVAPPSYLGVFRVTGAIGFMSYAFASLQDSVWFSRPWKSWCLQAVDAVLFGLLIGGTFGWLWPR